MKANNLDKIKVQLQESSWWRQVEKLIENACQGRKVHSVHCLGVGSFVNSANAMHQLACALLLKGLAPDCICSITDPAMLETDLKLAHRFGVQVVPFNELNLLEPLDSLCTILFMPHCGLSLNEEIFARCFKFKFKSTVFLANIFSNYANADMITTRSGPFVQIIQHLTSSEALQERRCPDANLSTRETAFNDLAVTTVDLSVIGDQTQLFGLFISVRASHYHKSNGVSI